jgi:hypothetical protein
MKIGRGGLGLVYAASALLGTSCLSDRDRLPEVVPAADPDEAPGFPVAGIFWGEIDPAAGKLEIYPVHAGNVIYRGERTGEHIEDLSFNYTGTAPHTSCTPGGSCRPAAGNVNLFTQQCLITFVDGSGVCHSNGGPCDGTCNVATGVGHAAAPPAGSPCAQNNTFCGPVQLVSNMVFGTPPGGTVSAMPDVVVQASNPTIAGYVLSCTDNATGDFGNCADTTTNSTNANNPSKVDSPSTSTLSSAITRCSYCYGNPNLAASRPGLASAVPTTANSMPNTTFKAINTDTFAMNLMGSASFGLTFTVRYSTPQFNPTAGTQITLSNSGTPVACATAGTTTVTLNGGGFGPPNSCLSTGQPPTCPVSGQPGTQYTVAIGMTTFTGTVSWSDSAISFLAPAVGGGCNSTISVDTPLGNVTSTDTLSYCSGSTSNSWRSWTPTGLTGVVQPAGATMTIASATTMVIAGGRTSVTDPTSATAAVQLLPAPAGCTANPNASAGPAMPTGVWGAQYATVGGNLYVIGGTSNGASCVRTTQIFNGSGWSTGTDMPDVGAGSGLCEGAAVALGQYIVVSGGVTVPVPNTASTGATLPTERTYVYDTVGNSWATFTTRPNIDNFSATVSLNRYGTAGASTGSLAIIAGGSTAGALGSPGFGYVSSQTESGGTPTFTLRNNKSNRDWGGAADLGGFFYYVGGTGSNWAATPPNGTQTLQRTSDSAPTTWTTLQISPRRRAGHVFLVGGSKLYAISGFDSTNLVAPVDEYTP